MGLHDVFDNYFEAFVKVHKTSRKSDINYKPTEKTVKQKTKRYILYAGRLIDFLITPHIESRITPLISSHII
jgi:hypothetical protein